MSAGRIRQGRTRLEIAIRWLAVDFRFNTVSFGSTFEPLLPESMVCDVSPSADAPKFVTNMQGDLEGTNMH
jgi:hypothetical protein